MWLAETPKLVSDMITPSSNRPSEPSTAWVMEASPATPM